ncbi:MAG: TerB family tellurite resistance protein [Rhodobiaceae bacterium]|nr:TerB family tellurite resistance protein [Rhodobiaceae bacterium]
MFNFFKKKEKSVQKIEKNLDIKLTASLLAYEIARSDGDIADSELSVILEELKKISIKVQKTEDDILQIVQNFSNNSVSFHEFIEDINKDYSKEDKLSLLSFLWTVAYADSILEVNEERLIRRIADLIHLKDMDVLKIKDKVKNNNA